MIKCRFVHDGNGPIAFEVKGHANTAPHGHDLVCAAVSAILIGGINALEGEDRFAAKIEEGHVRLSYQEEPSLKDRHVMATMEVQLESLAASYPKSVRLERTKA